MKAKSEKVCCNCSHNLRVADSDGDIVTICTFRHEILLYVQCMTGKCKHWSSKSMVSADDLEIANSILKEISNG